MIIVAMAAMIIGGTRAYFSDSVSIAGNTFSTGTIDIDVDSGDDQALLPIEIEGMKPGYTDYGNFTIENKGNNAANVWKKLYNFKTVNNIDKSVAGLSGVIIYDLSVKVYKAGENNPFWWQTIYADSDGETLKDVYSGLSGNGILLGMIPAGGKMEVVQSYHMDEDAGNAYQGETFSFDMKLYAEQLKNTVTMVHKTGSDWDDIDQSSDAKAVLTYGVREDAFNYDLSVEGLNAGEDYVIISGTNPWNGSDTVQVASFTTNGNGDYNATGQSIDFDQDLVDAKIWVIPANDWDNLSETMTAWNGEDYLFETALIEYVDPIK